MASFYHQYQHQQRQQQTQFWQLLSLHMQQAFGRLHKELRKDTQKDAAIASVDALNNILNDEAFKSEIHKYVQAAILTSQYQVSNPKLDQIASEIEGLTHKIGQIIQLLDEAKYPAVANTCARRRASRRQTGAVRVQRRSKIKGGAKRCICGTDGFKREPWIACDSCNVWQHIICIGMSVFSEDLPKHYYCENCRPQNHSRLLKEVGKGEKPWEARRHLFQELGYNLQDYALKLGLL
jgi:hypothetical protein